MTIKTLCTILLACLLLAGCESLKDTPASAPPSAQTSAQAERQTQLTIVRAEIAEAARQLAEVNSNIEYLSSPEYARKVQSTYTHGERFLGLNPNGAPMQEQRRLKARLSELRIQEAGLAASEGK